MTRYLLQQVVSSGTSHVEKVFEIGHLSAHRLHQVTHALFARDAFCGAINEDCVHSVRYMPAGQGVEGQDGVLTHAAEDLFAGQGCEGIACVSPVVAGAEGVEQFGVFGAAKSIFGDEGGEEVFPLGTDGSGIGQSVGIHFGIDAEGGANLVKIGKALCGATVVSSPRNGGEGDGDKDGKDAYDDKDFDEGHGARERAPGCDRMYRVERCAGGSGLRQK